MYFRQCCQCRVNCEERTSDGRHDRVLPIRFPHLIRHGQHDRDTRCIPRRAASEQERSPIDAWAIRGELTRINQDEFLALTSIVLCLGRLSNGSALQIGTMAPSIRPNSLIIHTVPIRYLMTIPNNLEEHHMLYALAHGDAVRSKTSWTGRILKNSPSKCLVVSGVPVCLPGKVSGAPQACLGWSTNRYT